MKRVLGAKRSTRLKRPTRCHNTSEVCLFDRIVLAIHICAGRFWSTAAIYTRHVCSPVIPKHSQHDGRPHNASARHGSRLHGTDIAPTARALGGLGLAKIVECLMLMLVLPCIAQWFALFKSPCKNNLIRTAHIFVLYKCDIRLT